MLLYTEIVAQKVDLSTSKVLQVYEYFSPQKYVCANFEPLSPRVQCTLVCKMKASRWYTCSSGGRKWNFKNRISFSKA